MTVAMHVQIPAPSGGSWRCHLPPTLAIVLTVLTACGADGPDGTAVSTATITAGPSAELASLSITEGALEPGFDDAQRRYTVDGCQTTTITAVPEDPAAEVELVHRTIDGLELDRGRSPFTITLEASERVDVVVTPPELPGTTYQVIGLPSDFPTLDVEVQGSPSPGLLYLCNFSFAEQPAHIGHYLMAIDPTGVPAWFRRVDGPTFDCRPQQGKISYIATHEGTWGTVLDATSYTTTATFASQPLANGAPVDTDVHELLLLPSGGALLNGLSPRVDDLTAWGGPDEVIVMDNVVQELDADGEVVFQWNTADHLSYDALPYTSLADMGAMWDPHINSIDVDPADGHLVISIRMYSQVVKVARTDTTFGGVSYEAGEILWRLGGVDGDFTFVGDERRLGTEGFSLQHSARVLPDGHLIVFDNALSAEGEATGDSRMVEYALDLDAMTATLVDEWELEGSGPTDAAGSVQRLPDGHTVIGWGNLEELEGGARAPTVTEIDEEGNVVFELRLPDGQWSYRAFKQDR